jgi:hypothetical protein
MKLYLISIFVMFFYGRFALRMRIHFYWLPFFAKKGFCVVGFVFFVGAGTQPFPGKHLHVGTGPI